MELTQLRGFLLCPSAILPFLSNYVGIILDIHFPMICVLFLMSAMVELPPIYPHLFKQYPSIKQEDSKVDRHAKQQNTEQRDF